MRRISHEEELVEFCEIKLRFWKDVSGWGTPCTKSPLYPCGQSHPRSPSLPVIPTNPTPKQPTYKPTNHPTSKPVIPSRPASPGSIRQLCAPHSAPPSGSPPCTTYHCQETKWWAHIVWCWLTFKFGYVHSHWSCHCSGLVIIAVMAMFSHVYGQSYL